MYACMTHSTSSLGVRECECVRTHKHAHTSLSLSLSQSLSPTFSRSLSIVSCPQTTDHEFALTLFLTPSLSHTLTLSISFTTLSRSLSIVSCPQATDHEFALSMFLTPSLSLSLSHSLTPTLFRSLSLSCRVHKQLTMGSLSPSVSCFLSRSHSLSLLLSLALALSLSCSRSLCVYNQDSIDSVCRFVLRERANGHCPLQRPARSAHADTHAVILVF